MVLSAGYGSTQADQGVVCAADTEDNVADVEMDDAAADAVAVVVDIGEVGAVVEVV